MIGDKGEHFCGRTFLERKFFTAPYHAYLYKVRAVDASGHYSPYSNADLATAVTFLDDPFPNNAPTRIKALHLAQLRDAINAIRVTAGLAPATWTNPDPVGARIQAQHVKEMREKLDEALAALNLPVLPYATDPDATQLQNLRIRKEHFQELRDRVK